MGRGSEQQVRSRRTREGEKGRGMRPRGRRKWIGDRCNGAGEGGRGGIERNRHGHWAYWQGGRNREEVGSDESG